MRITSNMRALVDQQGTRGFLKVCEEECVRLTDMLKRATDINVIFKYQGSIDTLEGLLKLGKSL